MSQAFGLKGTGSFIDEGLIMIIDDRASMKIDGKTYARKMPIKKYAIGSDNRLYVCFGCEYAINGAVHAIENLGMTDLKEICINSIPEQLKSEAEKQAKKEELLSVFKIDFVNRRIIAKACHFKEFSYDGLYEHELDITDSSYINFGIHDEDVEKWFNNYTKDLPHGTRIEIQNVLDELVEKFNTEQAGGIWTIFSCKEAGTMKLGTMESLMDPEIRFVEDSYNVCVEDNHGTIYGSKLFAGDTQPTQAEKDAVPEGSISGMVLLGTKIFAGTPLPTKAEINSAPDGIIKGAHIDGGDINIDTDLEVGKTINLRDGSTTGGTISIFNGTSPILSILSKGNRPVFISNGTASLSLNGNTAEIGAANATVNNKRIATTDDISQLQSQITALTSRVSALENEE